MKSVLMGGILMVASAAFPYNADINAISNEQMVVEHLSRYTFPTNDTELSFDFNFNSQSSDIFYLVQNDFMLGSTNSLLRIADFISRGVMMPVSNRVEDIRLAHAHDNFLELGTSNTVRRSGLIYHGPTARACIRKYNVRDSYNRKLRNLRRETLEDIRRQLGKPRWSIISIEDRTNLWEAVKRRMDATAEELQGIETLEILN